MVIHRLVLSLSLYLSSLSYLFSTEFIASRKLFGANLTFSHQGSTYWARESNKKLSWSKFEHLLSKALDLLEDESANLLGEIKNCGRCSDIVAVILPKIMSFEMRFMQILSTRVLE